MVCMGIVQGLTCEKHGKGTQLNKKVKNINLVEKI